MGELLRYAWRGSSAHWAKSWLNAIGAIVGAAIVDATGLPFELGDGFLARALFWAIGAVLGVAALFLARLCWWPVHCSFGPRGGIAIVLKERFGRNMWPVILMIAGIVLFVLLFGVGAVWYIWPKRDAAQASRPFTSADAQKLNAASLSAQISHLREAKVEFAEAAKMIDGPYSSLLGGYTMELPRLTGAMNLNVAKERIKGLVQRDLGEGVNLDQSPNYDRDHNFPAPDIDRVPPANRGSYRNIYDQYQTNKAKIARLQSLYDDRIKKLTAELATAVTYQDNQ